MPLSHGVFSLPLLLVMISYRSCVLVCGMVCIVFFILVLFILVYCPLQSTFAMLNWALRETVTKLIFHVRMLEGSGFLYMSYAILFFEYFISILFPNIWVAMSLTGATAAVYVAYILPGALILNVGGDGLKDRVFGAICVVLGVLMGVIGVANTLFLD